MSVEGASPAGVRGSHSRREPSTLRAQRRRPPKEAAAGAERAAPRLETSASAMSTQGRGPIQMTHTGP